MRHMHVFSQVREAKPPAIWPRRSHSREQFRLPRIRFLDTCRQTGLPRPHDPRRLPLRHPDASCRYGPCLRLRRESPWEPRERGGRSGSAASGQVPLQVPHRHPKICGNGTEPFGGDRMCPSVQDDKTCTMTKDGASSEYAGVTLSGGHKDRHLGIKIRQRFCIAEEVLCRGDLFRVKIRRRQLKDCKPASLYGADIHKKHPDSLPQAVSQAAK